MDGSARRILIVDPDVMSVIAAEEALRETGWTVDYLLGARNLLPKLDFWKPDVLLVEIDSPTFDRSLLARLRETDAYGDMVIILFSGLDAEQLQKLCVDYDLNGYFSKSIPVQELPTFIANFF